jgi:small subunit ribosomal protein S17
MFKKKKTENSNSNSNSNTGTVSTKGKRLNGVVVSDKMDKTAVVQVQRYFKDSKYGKFIKKGKNYKVHDPENILKIGDKVEIRETKPISKDKNFIISSKLN